MYRILIDDSAVYSPSIATSGYSVISPVLSLQVNTAGTLDFTVPDSNPLYNALSPMQHTIKVYDGAERIFRGRVVTSTKNFYKQKTLRCEGDLAYLNDVILRPYDYSGSVAGYFAYLVNTYQQTASAERSIRPGACTISDKNDYIVRASLQYPTVWAELSEKLLKTFGGYFLTRTEIENGAEVTYLDYLAEPGTDRSQTIRFGENILDLSDLINGAEIFNRIVPVGAVIDADTGERLTIKSVNDGKDYLEDAISVAAIGRIEKLIKWDDVTIAANLKRKAENALADAISLTQTLTINAVDLNSLGVAVDALRIGQNYMVISPPHGLTGAYFPLTRCTINLANPAASTYTFGVTKKTLTGG